MLKTAVRNMHCAMLFQLCQHGDTDVLLGTEDLVVTIFNIYIYINGNFRILKWRYLPYIRPM
jgi:hypothetical protein